MKAGVLILVALAVAGCSRAPSKPPNPVAAVAPKDQEAVAGMDGAMVLAPAALKLEIERARAGDNIAAGKLACHYGVLGSDKEATYWNRLAASRGNCGVLAALIESGQQVRHWKRVYNAYQCKTLGKPYGVC